MKKLFVALSLGLFFAIGSYAVAPSAASAKTVTGMPAHFRHTWYHGSFKFKFTKYHYWFGKTGHKFNSKNVLKFKHVYKSGNQYTPVVNSDIGAFKYSNGHVYTFGGSGSWMKFHR